MVAKTVKHFRKTTEDKNPNSIIIRMASLTLTLFIVLANFLLKIFVNFFTHLQRHFSNTKFYQSYIKVYIFLVFFNSAFVPYLINLEKENRQLIWDVNLIIISNAFSTPLFKIFDPKRLFRKFVQLLIKKKKIILTQYEANQWFEFPSIDIGKKFNFFFKINK